MKQFNMFLLSLFSCFVLGVSSTFAASKDDVNFGEMELNKVYQLVDFSSCYGTFKAPKTGYLLVRGTYSDILKPYKDLKETISETVSDNDNAYGYTMLKGYGSLEENGVKTPFLSAWEMPVEEGKTYILAAGTVMSNSKVVLTMNEREFVMTSQMDASDKVISPTVNGTVSFVFNRPVSYSSAILTIGGSRISVAGRTSSSQCSMSFELKTVIINQMRAGLLKKGDRFTLDVTGVKSEDGELLYNGDGKISVALVAGDMPTMIVEESANFSQKFMTWYQNDGEDGIFTLTFNNDLDPDYGKAVLRFGDSDQQEAGGYYQEEDDDPSIPNCFTMQIEGNKIILDFRGKRRTIGDMVSSTESNNPDAFKYLNLEISQIRDVNGVKTYTTTSTSNGKYNYKFELDNPSADVQSDFTPANGAKLDNADEVEIWINDESKLKYEGVDFVYTENGEEKTITVTEFDKVADVPEGDAADAALLTVKIPVEVKNKNNVIVRLRNVTCVDGKDYSEVIAAKYNVVASGIDNITMGMNKNIKVYNLNGQLVREGNSLHGLHGVYVVDGNKVVLK